MYYDSMSAVMVDGNLSETFAVSTGVLQDDVQASFLFVILVATTDIDTGIVIHRRQSRRHPAIVPNYLQISLMTLPCWNLLHHMHRHS